MMNVITRALEMMQEEGVAAVGDRDTPLIHRSLVYDDPQLAQRVIQIIEANRKLYSHPYCPDEDGRCYKGPEYKCPKLGT